MGFLLGEACGGHLLCLDTFGCASAILSELNGTRLAQSFWVLALYAAGGLVSGLLLDGLYGCGLFGCDLYQAYRFTLSDCVVASAPMFVLDTEWGTLAVLPHY